MVLHIYKIKLKKLTNNKLYKSQKKTHKRAKNDKEQTIIITNQRTYNINKTPNNVEKQIIL